MSRVLYDGPHRLREIEAYVRRIRQSGVKGECPVCNRCVHVNRRRLRIGLIRSLRHIIDLGRGARSSDMKTLARGRLGNDWHTLRYWGLISRVEGGEWFPTVQGLRFMGDRVSVPEFVDVENRRVVGQAERLVTIRQIFEDAERFDLDDFLRPWQPERAPPSAQRELALGDA